MILAGPDVLSFELFLKFFFQEQNCQKMCGFIYPRLGEVA